MSQTLSSQLSSKHRTLVKDLRVFFKNINEKRKADQTVQGIYIILSNILRGNASLHQGISIYVVPVPKSQSFSHSCLRKGSAFRNIG